MGVPRSPLSFPTSYFLTRRPTTPLVVDPINPVPLSPRLGYLPARVFPLLCSLLSFSLPLDPLPHCPSCRGPIGFCVSDRYGTIPGPTLLSSLLNPDPLTPRPTYFLAPVFPSCRFLTLVLYVVPQSSPLPSSTLPRRPTEVQVSFFVRHPLTLFYSWSRSLVHFLHS